MRRLQMLEILQWIKSLNIDQDEPVFIAGDFNVEFDSPEYESFLDGLPLEINYRKDDNVGGSFQAKVGSTKPQGPPTRPQRPLTRPQGPPTRPQGPLIRPQGPPTRPQGTVWLNKRMVKKNPTPYWTLSDVSRTHKQRIEP